MIKLSIAQLNNKKYSEIIVRNTSCLKGGDSTLEYLDSTLDLLREMELEDFLTVNNISSNISSNISVPIPMLGADY